MFDLLRYYYQKIIKIKDKFERIIQMKIICVCGLGMGSSLILKMNVEDVLTEAGVKAEVEHSDTSSARFEKCDYIVTTPDLAAGLENSKGKVVVTANIIKKDDIKKALVEGGIIV